MTVLSDMDYTHRNFQIEASHIPRFSPVRALISSFFYV